MKRHLSIFLVLLASCQGNLLFEPYPKDAPGDPRPLAALKRGFWVVGGQSSHYTGTSFPFVANLPAQIDVFDPETETWYPNVTQLPTPVSFAGVAGYKGKLYVVGGWDSQGAVQQKLQIYDLMSDTWTQGAVLPALRAGLELVGIEGDYLYATNGYNTNIDGAYANQNLWYMYQINSNTWLPRLNYGAVDQAVLSFRGIIHTVGGRTAVATLVNAHDGYLTWPTSSTDTATTTTAEIPAPSVRAGSSLTILSYTNGMPLLILSGGMSANPTGTPLAYIFRNITGGTLTNQLHFLPPPYEAGSWTLLTPTLPATLMYHQSLAYKTRLYVFGGASAVLSPSGLDTVYRFDLSNLTSVPAPATLVPMPVGRFGHRVVRISEFLED